MAPRDISKHAMIEKITIGSLEWRVRLHMNAPLQAPRKLPPRASQVSSIGVLPGQCNRYKSMRSVPRHLSNVSHAARTPRRLALLGSTLETTKASSLRPSSATAATFSALSIKRTPASKPAPSPRAHVQRRARPYAKLPMPYFGIYAPEGSLSACITSLECKEKGSGNTTAFSDASAQADAIQALRCLDAVSRRATYTLAATTKLAPHCAAHIRHVAKHKKPISKARDRRFDCRAVTRALNQACHKG
jgi:hypothetical protein